MIVFLMKTVSVHPGCQYIQIRMGLKKSSFRNLIKVINSFVVFLIKILSVFLQLEHTSSSIHRLSHKGGDNMDLLEATMKRERQFLITFDNIWQHLIKNNLFNKTNQLFTMGFRLGYGYGFDLLWWWQGFLKTLFYPI